MVITCTSLFKKYTLCKITKFASRCLWKIQGREEKNFFKNILGPEKNWSFLYNNRMLSYHYCDMSKLVVSSVSTLGYEAISRSSKVAIFNIFNKDNLSKSKNFCWPYQINKKVLLD